MNPSLISGLFCFCLVLAAAAAALFHWQRTTRHRRPPVEFKLLRGPGELSLRALRRIEATLPLVLLAAVLLPLFLGMTLFLYVPLMHGLPHVIVTTFGWMAELALLYFAGRHVYRRLVARRTLELRYLGERAVAEELAPLLPQGFRIFHDVAIHGVESDVDLDHVIVGPNGVTVIECEPRQRETAKNAQRDHEVTFDGKQLAWPWGADRDTVASLEGEAVSFTKWLMQTTGYRIQAYPLLTVPGWWVDITGRGLVEVVNHKQVLHAVNERTATPLEPEQIEKICRELELHCRDVEF
ncbi:MAG TPA: nuclease-related domain-containing protein [Opitutaceae bacterium]|nr:nuclease-related domain-containing protein [Opitutaceae bacterium]